MTPLPLAPAIAAVALAALPAAAAPALSLTPAATDIRTTDTLSLTLRATGFGPIPPTFDPPLADAFAAAGWTFRDALALPAAIDAEGGITHAWSITIEPFLDGDYALPTLTARAADAGPPVTTEPIPITVRSVLDAAPDETLESAKDLAAPLDPLRPAAPFPWLPVITLPFAALALVAMGLALSRRRGHDPVITALKAELANSNTDAAPALRRALAAAVDPRAAAMTADELTSLVSTQNPDAEAIIRAIAASDTHRFANRPADHAVIAAGRAAALRLLDAPPQRAAMEDTA